MVLRPRTRKKRPRFRGLSSLPGTPHFPNPPPFRFLTFPPDFGILTKRAAARSLAKPSWPVRPLDLKGSSLPLSPFTAFF